MIPENDNSNKTDVNTGGGAFTGGNVDTGGGDFAGRDKVVDNQIFTGAITGSSGVTIGHGASVTIVHQPMQHLVPLQRPPRVEHFQDREQDLAQLLADLQPGQVVTLCGPGGIGKTALASQAIWQLAPGDQPPDRFPDGILFHSFYQRGQSALAFERIARSFGEEIQSMPLEAAQRALAGKQALLILDSAEEADDLQTILDLRDQCCVLITSRRRQDAGAIRQDLKSLPPTEAVALLQAWGKQRTADENILNRISELVGRLPLALRLVGRYLNQTEEDATDYLNWLEQTPIAALDQGQHREESIHLLLRQSLMQVSEQARLVLGVIGLLAFAPFERGIIAAALALESSDDIMRPLGELVNYGLLTRRERAYEVNHALIHVYARQTLFPSSEVINGLANHYRAFVNEHRSEFDHLNRMRPHILALLRICSERSLWPIARQLAWAIDDYLDIQGFWTARLLTIEIGLAAARALQDRQEESAWLVKLGKTYTAYGKMEEATKNYKQGLEITREINDRNGEANYLGELGTAYASLGELEQAITHFKQALTITQEIGHPKGVSNHLNSLGRAYYALGQVQQAISYFEQVLEIDREGNDQRSISYRLGNLGRAYAALGKINEAAEYFREALAIAKAIGDRRAEGNHLAGLGGIYYAFGDMDQALHYDNQALELAQEIGDRFGEGNRLGYLGKVYAARGELPQAIEYYNQALGVTLEIGDRRGQGNHLANLGELYHSLGEFERAIDLYTQALVIARSIHHQHGEAKRLTNIGMVYADLGHTEYALKYYEQALNISRAIGHRRREGKVLANLGKLYEGQGDTESAVNYYSQALMIAREIVDRRGEGSYLSNLSAVYAALGQMEPAREYGEQALHILEAIKSPNAEKIRGWLETLVKQ